MNKKLYIRFFEYEYNQIPHKSWPIAEKKDTIVYLVEDADITEMTRDWMKDHAKGKVDFVWI